MTAVAMIFEMTRDYDIVLPMILAVAMSLGVRRILSRENMYTMKLFRRGHLIPKALHANMFLVRPAKEVMDTDVVQLPAETRFGAFLGAPENRGRMRHVAVTAGNRIVGVLRVNTALRQVTSEAPPGAKLGDLASAAYTIAHADDIMFEVIEDIWRRKATMALVIRDRAAATPENIVGVITKEHVADSVASSVKYYSR
jgi:CIC family chloride channel protein